MAKYYKDALVYEIVYLKGWHLQNRHYGLTLMGKYKVIIIIFEFTSEVMLIKIKMVYLVADLHLNHIF